jgi:hypothetical protein
LDVFIEVIQLVSRYPRLLGVALRLLGRGTRFPGQLFILRIVSQPVRRPLVVIRRFLRLIRSIFLLFLELLDHPIELDQLSAVLAHLRQQLRKLLVGTNRLTVSPYTVHLGGRRPTQKQQSGQKNWA